MAIQKSGHCVPAVLRKRDCDEPDRSVETVRPGFDQRMEDIAPVQGMTCTTWAEHRKGRHPYGVLSSGQQLGLSVALALISWSLHRRQSVNAKTKEAPHGTMSFVLANRSRDVQRIRSSWSRSTRQAVDGNLRLDMAFSLTWTNAIALADLWAAGRLSRPRLGDAMAWGQWGAALLAPAKDIEKVFALRDGAKPRLEDIGRWAAVTEISIKSSGIVFALAPVCSALFRRRKRLARYGA